MTARSRIDEYFGQKRDLESMCEFMARWLSENDRWGSPVFIAGESYGGYRVGRLVRMLQEEAGIGLNGAILISPALELSRSRRETTTASCSGSTCCRRWPAAPLSTAARAPSRPERPPTRSAQPPRSSPAATMRRSSSAAPRLDASERERILQRLADFLGLPLELVVRGEGRVSPFVFTRELLRDERKVAGFYDAHDHGTDPFPDRPEHSAPDPTLAGISPAYTAAVNRQLRSEIGVKTDREYRLLSLEVNQAWKEDTTRHFFAPPEGATD